MNLETLISPTNLRDYAEKQGWVLLNEAEKDRLYVMTNPKFERRQLVFPIDTTAPDSSEAVMIVVNKLAAMENRSTQELINNILRGDDIDEIKKNINKAVMSQYGALSPEADRLHSLYLNEKNLKHALDLLDTYYQMIAKQYNNK
jgi:hypothetical protein